MLGSLMINKGSEALPPRSVLFFLLSSETFVFRILSSETLKRDRGDPHCHVCRIALSLSPSVCHQHHGYEREKTLLSFRSCRRF